MTGATSLPGASVDPDVRSPKDTAQNRAYLVIRNAIMAGHFHPGTVLTLRRLSEMFNVGEMPVRESLKRLASEGAFEALPNRSARVPRLTRRQIAQILDLRLELEGRATADAVENISKRHIEELVALDTRMSGALVAGELLDYAALNQQFHFLIYGLAQNETLYSLIEALWLRMGPLVSFSIAFSSKTPAAFRKASAVHHLDLIDALRVHDVDAARTAVRADLSHLTQVPGYWEAMENAPDMPALQPTLESR
jgi:DNA-binding GntR family transcriptional regulator